MAGRVETMVETKTILVAGATGQQGGSVARALVKHGHRVRGLTRDPEKIDGLKTLGLDGVRGDLTDKASLAPALRGVDAFFIVTTPFRPDFSVDVETEVVQGTTAIDAAKAARVPHVVLSSVASADGGTGIPHFESKATVERHLKGSGLRYTITRPVAFMDNYASPWILPQLQAGVLAQPMPATTRQQIVAVRDIGEIVARAIEAPARAAGKTVELAGDSLTMADIAARLAGKLGHPVRYVEQPDQEVLQGMGEDGMRMFRFFREKGYHVDIAALEREWGYRMTRFDEFLKDAVFTPKW